MYVSMQGILALYASGRTTGVVLYSGDGVTQTVPVYNNNIVHEAVFRLDLAGAYLVNVKVKINPGVFNYKVYMHIIGQGNMLPRFFGVLGFWGSKFDQYPRVVGVFILIRVHNMHIILIARYFQFKK